MNAIRLLAEQAWVERLGWTLVHFLWQGVLIAAVYTVARRWLVTSGGPRARYLLACAALVLLVAAPIVTFTVAGARQSTDANTFTERLPASVASKAETGTGPALPVVSGLASQGDVIPGLVMAWFVGAIGFWLRMLGGWVVATRMRSMLVRPAPYKWQRTLDMIAARMRVSRPLQLLVSGLVQVPTVVGWLRPVVLMPIGALAGLPVEHIEALLAHELAHIRRHDYLVNLLQSLAEALLFYHPAVWWVSKQIRDEREHCCDDIAAGVSGGTLTYVQALADLESYRPSHLTPALAASGGSLTDRIARLLGAPRQSRSLFPGSGAVACVIATLLIAVALFAQSEGARISFEVASVKENTSGDRRMMIDPPGGGKLTARSVTVTWLLQFAYKVQWNLISGGPGWADSARFDIAARAENRSATDGQIRQMVRTLLEDRFRLKLHLEPKELPIYTLVMARPAAGVGHDLHKTATECSPFSSQSFAPATASNPPPCPAFSMSTGGQLSATGATMEDLAHVLTDMTGRTVRDRTGLAGQYDLRLSWTPDQATPFAGSAPGAPPPDPSGPSIFTSLQEQLGLKLQSERGPVDVLVIDHLEKPSEN